MLEVTGADKAERRSRGKDDTLDAITAACAAFEGIRIGVAKQGGGQIEALRVLPVTRQTVVKARRTALQQLRNTIIAAPGGVRDQTHNVTRMQLIRSCATWRPDVEALADPVVAIRIALKSLARRIIKLNDEIATLDESIKQLVRELTPKLLDAVGIGVEIGYARQ